MPIRKTRLLNPKQPGSSHFIYFNCLLDTVRIIAGATESSFLAVISFIILFIFFAFGIAALLPGIAVTVRRLRDAGYNWAFIFIPLIPFVGGIIFIVLLCQPTKVEVPFSNFNNPQQ
ncbi:Putative membrane protein (TMS3) [Streptococcus sp. HSISS3]|nr:Putative membrane protein (TMS3) [Streptococcus sp. HSISS3]